MPPEFFFLSLSHPLPSLTSLSQPVHHDTTFDMTPSRLSLLIALCDVENDMGPTIFFPKTHTPEWHVQYMMRDEELEDLLSNSEHVRGVLGMGDSVLYDTRLLHCASSNDTHQQGKTKKRRTLLTLSFQEENADNRREQANIRKGYRGALKLSEWKDWKVRES